MRKYFHTYDINIYKRTINLPSNGNGVVKTKPGAGGGITGGPLLDNGSGMNIKKSKNFNQNLLPAVNFKGENPERMAKGQDMDWMRIAEGKILFEERLFEDN